MPLKYIVNFVDRIDTEYRIEINVPNYIGSPIVLESGATPLVIDYNGNQDDNVFRTHIVSSSITFQVVSTNLDVNELMYVSDANFKCHVYQNNILYWQGFIISDGIQEIDSGVPYDITLKAIDGLEVLNNVRMNWGDNYPLINVNGFNSIQRCPMNAIRLALYRTENLDNRLPIRWNSSLKNDKSPNRDMLAGDTSLNQYGELLKFNYSVLWWVDSISKSAQSWMYQSRGYWYINNYFDTVVDGNFNGHEISSDTSSVQIASVYNDVELTEILPKDTINESWFWFGKKPLGKTIVTYNDTKFDEKNAIPNGGFDTISPLGVRPLYWYLTNGKNYLLSNEDPINDDTKGYSIKVDNKGSFTNPTPEDTYLTFGSIPIDCNILFKQCLFTFTWLPVEGFNIDSAQKLIDGQLRVRIKYTAYQDGVVKNLYLNEFGYWSGYGISYNGLSIVFVSQSDSNITVRFSGNGANAGQFYRIQYVENDPNNPSVNINESHTFSSDASFVDALNQIALSTGGVVSGDEIIYSVVNPSNVSSDISGSQESASDIAFQYTNAKHGDVVSIQFRSQGNASGIKMPDPGVITPGISNLLGRLSVEFYSKAGTIQQFDDVVLSLDDNHDVFEVYKSGSKNSTEEYSMNISSGFSGNMPSSYGDTYSTTNESMFWNSGKTLTELYATAIMDIRNKPIRVFSGDIDKLMDWGLFKLMDKTYAPLSLSVNVKDRISTIVGAEFNTTPDNYTITHKSSGAN